MKNCILSLKLANLPLWPCYSGAYQKCLFQFPVSDVHIFSGTLLNFFVEVIFSVGVCWFENIYVYIKKKKKEKKNIKKHKSVFFN